jgi:hypothetical protein
VEFPAHRSSLRTATTAQQFCSIASVESLIGRDGISKTMVWKKCVALKGTSHMRERSLCGMPVPTMK